MREPTAEMFLKDVSNHGMEVLLDDGCYRHLRFKQKPHSWNMHFSLVTWPGYLTICGDMGTWTFSRLHDMFEFFRDSKLRINPGYWGEKVQNGTHGGRDNCKSFSAEAFSEALMEDMYELAFPQLTTATECFQELTPAAKAFVIDRWQKWKGLA